MLRWRHVLLIGLFVGTPAPAYARTPEITVLYDTEFGGYVPVVGGIERPDLVVEQGDGRAPTSPRVALRRAKRGARRDQLPEVLAPATTPHEGRGAPRRLSRRWLRRTAVTTDILALDPHGRPIGSARVYRYYDPSFYPVNQDASGARLFGAWRFLPRPFPGSEAATTIAVMEEHWRALSFAPVAEITPDISERSNPWVRTPAAPTPPVEFLGWTSDAGTFRSVSGVFNLRDKERFARTIVPSTLRIGFVIIADGHLPATSERRFSRGGVHESRTVQLLRGPDHGLYTSGEWRVTERILDGLPPASERDFDAIAREMNQRLDRLTVALALVPAEQRTAVRREAEARLWRRLARRASPQLQLPIARRLVELTPASAARLHLLARLLAADADAREARRTEQERRPADAETPPAPELLEAVQLLTQAVNAEPRFLPAYQLLDQLLVRRGAAADERRQWIARLLREHPFDLWARARMAALMLGCGRNAEAFDHLRHTYMALPGLGGDRELALALSAFYWKIGLPEKAGAYAWLLTGRPPEDPFTRPRFASQ